MQPKSNQLTELTPNDMRNIQIFYGPNYDNSNLIFLPDDVPDDSEEPPDLCKNPKIDTISYSFKQSFYLFKDLHVFELINEIDVE